MAHRTVGVRLKVSSGQILPPFSLPRSLVESALGLRAVTLTRPGEEICQCSDVELVGARDDKSTPCGSGTGKAGSWRAQSRIRAVEVATCLSFRLQC